MLLTARRGPSVDEIAEKRSTFPAENDFLFYLACPLLPSHALSGLHLLHTSMGLYLHYSTGRTPMFLRDSIYSAFRFIRKTRVTLLSDYSA